MVRDTKGTNRQPLSLSSKNQSLKVLPPQKEGTDQYQIISVCGSDIFRSPMLAYLIQRCLEKLDISDKFEATSRGLHIERKKQEKPEYETDIQRIKDWIIDSLLKLIDGAKNLREGIRNYFLIADYVDFLEEHIPEELTWEDVKRASLILTATREHRKVLLERFKDVPDLNQRVFLVTQLLDENDSDFGLPLADIGTIEASELFLMLSKLVEERLKSLLEQK